jgi:hypothetical protein
MAHQQFYADSGGLMSVRTDRARQGLTLDQRVSFVEQDLDATDASIDALTLTLKNGLGKMQTLMMSLLVSIATACILLAINLTINK